MNHEEILTRIAAAADLSTLDALRVETLGKSGSVTAMLKSLGGMDADTRTREAPAIHALRETITASLAARKDALRMPNWSGGWRPNDSTCRCPQRRHRAGRSTRLVRSWMS